MIAILLSTYNGADYIGKQIDSLLSQTYQDFTIYIRDDGSNDGTIGIIDSFVNKFPDKVKHVDQNGDNLGVGQSFMWLLEHAMADYYMYCDQDDVWLPEKVELTLKKIQEIDKTGHAEMPCCAFTDAIIVDGQLNHLYDSLWKSNYRNPEDAKDVYRYAVYRQAALGCTMIFNNGARRYALQNKQFPFRRGQHDRFVVYLCAVFGKVTYLDKPLIKYRQHGKNVTSYINKTQTRFSVVENILLSPKKVHSHLSDNFGRLKMLPINVSYAKIFVMLIQKWIFTSKWKK